MESYARNADTQLQNVMLDWKAACFDIIVELAVNEMNALR